MVASDGYRGTPREPVNPSEGWRTATDRKNRRKPEEVKSKISKLVENALREMHAGRNTVAEVAPHNTVKEVSNRSQTTGNFEENKFVLEKEPKKKRWRRMRSWRPITSFPSREERELLNKDVNTMSRWGFEQAISKHFHNAAATVYTNYSTREALFRVRNKDHFKLLEEVSELKRRNEHFIYHSNTYMASSKEYLKWWSTHFENEHYDRPVPPVTTIPNKRRHHGFQSLRPVKESHRCSKVQHQRVPVKERTPLRLSKLRRLDRLMKKEFYSDSNCYEVRDPDKAYGHGYTDAFNPNHDGFNIRFPIPFSGRSYMCRVE